MATGVLLLCLGDATRVSDMLMDGGKWYLARITFGAATDTDDALGSVISRSQVSFALASLVEALKTQVGSVMQTPPTYAAIKNKGVPNYQRARAGKTVEVTPRSVTVHSINLLDFQPNRGRDPASDLNASDLNVRHGGLDRPPAAAGWKGRDPQAGALRLRTVGTPDTATLGGMHLVEPGGEAAVASRTSGVEAAEDAQHAVAPSTGPVAWPAQATILVSCGKGTYIRSIARDVGMSLDCGAHLSGLRRLASGRFTTRDCVKMEELQLAVAERGPNALEPLLAEAGRAVEDWPAIVVDERRRRDIVNGVQFVVESGLTGPRARLYGVRGDLLGLADVEQQPSGCAVVHPFKVFAGAVS